MTHYARAPITEALIDLQFKGRDASTEELATLAKGPYSEKKPVFLASVRLGGENSPDELPTFTTQPTSQMGWAFIAADKLKVWQVRSGGFTFSRLAPYESWGPFRDEARTLWELSRPILKPQTFTRVAVRYINRFELPLPLGDFKDYLRTVPEISPLLPQGLSTFFMQLQIPQPDSNAVLVLNQQLLPLEDHGQANSTASILLDIDLFIESGLPQNEVDVWELLEQLHLKKNLVFEACITDRMRDLIG